MRTYTLGQFFAVWGVRFPRDCLGGSCAAAQLPSPVPSAYRFPPGL